MKIHTSGVHELHMSDDIYKEIEDTLESEPDLNDFLDMNIEDFLGIEKQFKEYIDCYATLHSLEGVLILEAHGAFDEDNNFIYYDGERIGKIQDWINEHDGEKATLLIRSCNPGGLEIYAEKSIVVVPNQIYSGVRQQSGLAQVEMYVPGKAYITSYVIEYELNQLRKELKQKSI